jgi:diguanylate cyclase (GGDEF)-like protein
MDDVPISAKAFAASSVLLLCLIGLGTNGYLALNRAATGLLHHSKIELPKQRSASELTRDITSSHLKIFRHVTWAQVGVGADVLKAASADIFTELGALGDRLRRLGAQPHLSATEIERTGLLVAKWDKYVREIADVMAAAATDASMASMLLGATDDEFQSIASELQRISSLVADRTSSASQELTTGAEWNRDLLALGVAIGVLISLLVTLLVRRSVVAPIRSITQAMRGVSSGDGHIDIDYRNRRDEIGQMVQAVAVFRQTMEHQNKLLAEREDKLQIQNLRFDTAMENMSHGLAMFDAEQRLVICNNRYAEIYGLAPELMKPGTTIRQLLEYRHAKGVFGKVDVETFAQDWLTEFRRASSRIQELADGRVVSIVRRRMPDGGLVSTTEDITERHKLNAQLDAALSNMAQGLAMFDAELRLVIANARYAEMYGLDAEQVKAGTSLQQIVEHRFAKGHYGAKTIDEVLDPVLVRAAGREASHHVSELSDGRFIAVSVQPMANGGKVATHHDVTDQRRSEAKIAHMASHDALTGLPNRVLLNERLELAVARARRGEIVAIHLFDLDLFKNVNDTFGHAAGDKLLKTVADRLRALVRDTDTIARTGGDEFAIVQLDLEQAADATMLAERIIEGIGEPYEIDGHQVVVGTSVGIAVGPTDGVDSDQLMRNADLAMYRAKSEGRGTYRFFEPGMDEHVKARRAMETDMRKALVEGQFELYYQPVLNLERNEITGCEALIRWRHPEKGTISPGDFIPLAEANGFIVPLGEWVIRQACLTAGTWPGHIRVAVNLSPAQFKSPGIVQVVVGALAASCLSPQRLELEITETVLLDNSATTLAILHQLRGLGVRVAMDDFGTGYSSLSYLQSFPFDKIKIDRSFIKGIAEGLGSLNIVRAVSALAKGLGMTTTAEGVETKEQLDTIRSEGCTEMQGFFFSRPLPTHEIERLFLSDRREKAAGAA